MSNIENAFKAALKRGEKAFIPYIMAGDPSEDETVRLVRLLSDCRADIIELGVPFSDPVADGPVIEAAADRALSRGTTLRRVIGLVKKIRETSKIPIVLMTYYNPIFKYGEEKFCADAKAAGVDGMIIPDLPPDEADTLIPFARKEGLDTIFLLAPTSTEKRIKLASKSTRGFLYYVPITGITGAALKLEDTIKADVSRIRNAARKPVAVGFGVKTPEDARMVASLADGVIIGSAIVGKISGAGGDYEVLRQYLLGLRNAIK